MARSLLWLVLASSWCEPAASFAPRARARRARAAVAVRAEPVNPSSRAAIDRESGYSYDPGGRIVHEDDLPPPPPMAQPEPVLMRVKFRPAASPRSVRELVGRFPFASLRGNPRTEPAADGEGTRLLFQRPPTADEEPGADGAMLVDGGLLLSVVPIEVSGATGPMLDVSRIAEGCGDMPKVIREKQVRESVEASDGAAARSESPRPTPRRRCARRSRRIAKNPRTSSPTESRGSSLASSSNCAGRRCCASRVVAYVLLF